MDDMPHDIDRDALKILNDAGFRWDSKLDAFRRGASTIDYAFLREQKLIAGASIDDRERIGQLQRLRILIQSLD
jgi:hypothetical protein